MSATCRHCGKPLYQTASGSFDHEQRAKPDDYTGRRKAPTPLTKGPEGGTPSSGPSPKEEPKPEVPPKREHLLHKVIGGKKDE